STLIRLNYDGSLDTSFNFDDNSILPASNVVIRCFDILPDGKLIVGSEDRKSTRLNSSHVKISYAVFCLKKKNIVVGASESPEPENDLGYLKEFMIHPFEYTYRGHKETKIERNLLVDYSGDNFAHMYVLQ